MENTARIMVYTTEELHRELKIHCAKTGEKISTVAERAIKEYLERNPAK